MMVPADVRVRSALQTDQRQIASLIHFSPHVHRHLDWRNPLDWIGSPPFFVLESQGQVSATLGCPPDPPSVAWVRLFVNSGKFAVDETWKMLWEMAQTDLARKGQFTAAIIVLQDWVHDLLLASGFASHQSIVMLDRGVHEQVELTVPGGISVRTMMSYEIPIVAEIDAEAFAPLWQNSLPSLERAYPQSVLATVAEVDGQVVGYQLSTRNPLGAHLARLAVRPVVQGRGVGYALVADLIQQAGRRGIARLTVNTQNDNDASLALYKRIGFRETGERYPVYQLQVP
jgi:[ribosomal protein S18]-alanine N-acetyltransferase